MFIIICINKKPENSTETTSFIILLLFDDTLHVFCSTVTVTLMFEGGKGRCCFQPSCYVFGHRGQTGTSGELCTRLTPGG